MSRYARRSHASHVQAASELRSLPGAWLQVQVYRAATTAASTANKIRNGRLSYSPPGAFEARLRQVDDGTAVEARYAAEGGGSDD